MRLLTALFLSAWTLPLAAADAPASAQGFGAAAPAPLSASADAFMLPDVTVAAARSKPKDGELVWEGFESGVTLWGSGEEGGRLKASLSRAVASEGDHAFGGPVEISELKGDAKAGFWLQPGGVDFRGINSFGFDLYNGSKASWEAKVIFQTGDEWQWNESQAFAIQPGWNKGLWLDLKQGDFSGKKGLIKPEKMVKISILCRPKEPVQGALYLDNVRLAGPGAAAMAPKRLAGLKEYLVNSFEYSDGGMKPAYGTASRTEFDGEHFSDGSQGLKLVAQAQDPEQNAQFGMDKEADLGAVQAVVLDVYNPGPPGILALTLSHGEWKYVEGPSARLQTGWNHDLTFDLQGNNFKSEASNWQANRPVPDFKVRRLGLSWNAGDTGRLSLTVDRLRFIAADDVAAKAFSPPPPLKGYGSELYAAGGAPPFVPRSEWSGARSASFSESFSLAGEGPALRLAYDVPPTGYSAEFEWSLPLDLRGVRAFVIDAYNPNATAVDLAYVAQTGPSQLWHQSDPVRLAPGWNHGLMLSVEGPVFQGPGNSRVSLPGRGPDTLKKAFWHVVPVAKGPGSIHLAKVRTLRASVVPGGTLPVAAEGSLKAGVDFEPVSYELWDSGAGEGSFEKGLSGWQSQGGSGFNAAVISLGAEGASQGGQGLKLSYRGSGNDKVGFAFDPAVGGALPDLSRVTRMRFDVYNSGPPMAVGVAFTVDPLTHRWIESPSVILRSGWNRDVTLEMDSWAWKVGVPNSAPGADVPRGPFPAELRAPGNVEKVTFLFQKARIGTVWVDNIRWGYPGSSTRHYSDVELGLRTSLGPLELKAALKAGHSADGSAWWQPGGMHAGLQGLGQKLTLSFGEGLTPFDDPLGLFTGKLSFSEGLNGYSSVVMDQLSALAYEGSVAGLGLRAFGALPWGPAPFSWDGHAFGGLRAKAAGGPAGSYLGATWLHQRLGYEPGADVLSSPVEQSSQVLGVDTGFSFGGLSLKGAYAVTYWALERETLLLHDSQGLPLLYSKAMDPRRDAWKANANYSLGPLDLSGGYQDVGYGFDNTLSDTMDLASKMEGKALLHLDALGALKQRASQPGSLLKGASVSVELYTYYKLDDPEYLADFPVQDGAFASDTYQARLENGGDAPVRLILSYQYKAERKARGAGLALEPNLDIQDLRFQTGTGLWKGATLRGLYDWTSFDRVGAEDSVRNTLGLSLAQGLWSGHSLTLGGAYFSEPIFPGGGGGALHASFRSAWTESVFSSLSYGRAAFDDNGNTLWWNQDPVVRLSVEGSF